MGGGLGGPQEEINIEPDIDNNSNNVILGSLFRWDHHLERIKTGGSRLKVMFILGVDEKEWL